MIHLNEKQDLTAITKQRDQIGQMMRRALNAELLRTDREATTPLAKPAPVLPEVDAKSEVESEAEAGATAAPALEELRSEPKSNAVEEEDDPDQKDPPRWIIDNASLSELLLWRLGIPLDRAAVEREHAQSQAAIDLKPPITTRKVADAIAHLSLQLMEGKIDANNAKTSLYALQTLLTALRLQIVEEKKSRDAKKKKSRRSKPNAKRKR